MSTYKSFAVIGAGTVGLPILSTLAAQNVSVVLLSRKGVDASKTLPAGVQVAIVDYADAAAVAAVFEKYKVDVVISTVASDAVPAQTVLVDAAKSAGVKLFVPSEFGMTSEAQPHDPKFKVAEHIRNVGLPYALFFNGAFTEFIPHIFPVSDGKITIVGSGEVPISVTSLGDVAGFVAYVLTTLPPAELENRIFRLQGDRATLKEVAATLNATVKIVDKITGPMGELKTYLMTKADTGIMSTGYDVTTKAERTGNEAAGSANSLWPGHQWKTIKDVISA
ncbi:hypothetical protein DFH07DRAFT_962479 [Mycena maculata]|uniref:NmrA-like domain-containing protein n=1 Tax=Mycena maculata TaxID=230809 RepID=A0AAD7IS40_9AGAR|nr:hypothetical protein DFH07DRAFT_962479 [Mycena maculata]